MKDKHGCLCKKIQITMLLVTLAFQPYNEVSNEYE